MTIDRLREKRLKLRCSQSLVERVSGVSRTRISAIECHYAEPTADELKRIDSALAAIERKVGNLIIEGRHILRPRFT